MDANRHSVKVRYCEIEDAEFVLEQRFLLQPVTAVQALKFCACLAYQSCEFKEWDTGPARALLSEIEATLLRALPGYDKAAWCI